MIIGGALVAPLLVFLIARAPSPKSSFTLVAAGDVMLGRGVADALERTSIDAAFVEARDAFAGSDLAFVNLESILSSTTNQSTKVQLYFKADPARVDVLQFLELTDVSVANNHETDYGEAAWNESVAHVQDAGIHPVGGYRNDGVPVVEEKQGRKIVFLAYEDVDRAIDDAAMVKQIQSSRALGDILVVSFHWGVEYQHFHTQRQADLAHEAIDAGADLIIGSHPHVLQGIEKYNNGLILYSLGNFVFDQSGDDQNETVVAKIIWQGTERTLELDPMRIAGDFPRAATADERKSTLERIAGWSDPTLSEEIMGASLSW